MSAFRSTLVTLLVTYVLGVLLCRWLVFGAVALNAPTVAAMIAVPIVQAAAIEAWRRIGKTRARR